MSIFDKLLTLLKHYAKINLQVQYIIQKNGMSDVLNILRNKELA